MRIASSIAVVAIVAAAGACGHNNAQNGSPQTAAQAQAAAAGCPMAQLQGVRASVADTDEGVAVTFTAPENEVDALRDHVNAMVDANKKQGDAFSACACGVREKNAYGSTQSQGGAYEGSGKGAGRASMQHTEIQAEASESDIPTGAVLKLKAKDKAQLQALRDDVREDIRAMKSGGCLSR